MKNIYSKTHVDNRRSYIIVQNSSTYIRNVFQSRCCGQNTFSDGIVLIKYVQLVLENALECVKSTIEMKIRAPHITVRNRPTLYP